MEHYGSSICGTAIVCKRQGSARECMRSVKS